MTVQTKTRVFLMANRGGEEKNIFKDTALLGLSSQQQKLVNRTMNTEYTNI